MMPWGRERLAEGAYEAALAELNKPTPNNQKALWHLDCATNLNPKFTEAIELKQRISGRELTTADNSSIRRFVKEMVINDRAPATQPSTGTRVDDGRSPANKPGNPTASKDPGVKAEEAEIDWESLPLEPAQPDSDQVVAAAKPATTQPSKAAAPEAPVAAKSEPKSEARSEEKSEKKAPDVQVTELPIEEVNPDAPKADDNK
jgi:hypothetical protein